MVTRHSCGPGGCQTRPSQTREWGATSYSNPQRHTCKHILGCNSDWERRWWLDNRHRDGPKGCQGSCARIVHHPRWQCRCAINLLQMLPSAPSPYVRGCYWTASVTAKACPTGTAATQGAPLPRIECMRALQWLVHSGHTSTQATCHVFSARTHGQSKPCAPPRAAAALYKPRCHIRTAQGDFIPRVCNACGDTLATVTVATASRLPHRLPHRELAELCSEIAQQGKRCRWGHLRPPTLPLIPASAAHAAISANTSTSLLTAQL